MNRDKYDVFPKGVPSSYNKSAGEGSQEYAEGDLQKLFRAEGLDVATYKKPVLWGEDVIVSRNPFKPDYPKFIQFHMKQMSGMTGSNLQFCFRAYGEAFDHLRNRRSEAKRWSHEQVLNNWMSKVDNAPNTRSLREIRKKLENRIKEELTYTWPFDNARTEVSRYCRDHPLIDDLYVLDKSISRTPYSSVYRQIIKNELSPEKIE